MVLRGLAKIASKNTQHQFTLYIRSTFILYKNMYSSNTVCIKNKKNSTKYVSHHTVSKFHRFFLSKMFMRIHFFFWLLNHRTDWKSPIFTRPKNRLHVLTREWLWIYQPRPIFPGHIWRSLFLKFYHTHYKYMYTYIIISFWYW